MISPCFVGKHILLMFFPHGGQTKFHTHTSLHFCILQILFCRDEKAGTNKDWLFKHISAIVRAAFPMQCLRPFKMRSILVNVMRSTFDWSSSHTRAWQSLSDETVLSQDTQHTSPRLVTSQRSAIVVNFPSCIAERWCWHHAYVDKWNVRQVCGFEPHENGLSMNILRRPSNIFIFGGLGGMGVKV
jgi:hypothetical protein